MSATTIYNQVKERLEYDKQLDALVYASRIAAMIEHINKELVIERLRVKNYEESGMPAHASRQEAFVNDLLDLKSGYHLEFERMAGKPYEEGPTV